MSRKEKLDWLEFDLFRPYSHLRHASFSRHGGTSQGSFDSLNLSDAVGDQPDRVKENRDLVHKVMGTKIVYAHQAHTAQVHRITAKNATEKLPTCDALFTTERNVSLAITHADCQAALFYDPVHEAIGVAHAGWRGLVQNIYARLLEAMHRELGTQAHNVLVAVSPSLGPDHAEFRKYKQEFPSELWGFQKRPYHFDLWAIGRKQLNACGVPDKQIELAETCTCCNSSDYFSYRVQKETGRNATLISLSE
ncbi:MAG: peptidoglycan editing factor PgeF [Verrucomicrobiota bacterium]|nr:peptidoglycan editing factor PgeF [Verrucomicrobiota bacterium]